MFKAENLFDMEKSRLHHNLVAGAKISLSLGFDLQ